MIRSRSWTAGRREEFAITLSFSNDPDEGRGVSKEYAATWGGLQIWVNGLNHCQHRELGCSIEEVHWYMYPVIRWFVANWDYLLHEERLPNKNLERDAWLTMRHTADPPPAASDEQAEQWEVLHQDWWGRHSLLACREGGLFPNIFIRRFRDSIEFSWGPASVAGKPEHYSFFAAHGYARISPQIVVDHLESVLDSATLHLCGEMPEVRAFQQLREEFEAIHSDGRKFQRLGLMAGLSGNGVACDQRYKSLARRISERDPQGAWNSFLDGVATKEAVFEAPQVCLMFGSLAPTITDADIGRLVDVVVASHSEIIESPKLKRMVRHEPILSALERPWDRGYELAIALHEALSSAYLEKAPVDIEQLFNDFDIATTDITLDDNTIRAIAIAGEKFRPTVAINANYRFQERHPRRFILAHELCHLLHDRTHGVRLALASGPWAPVDIEKRANAFAAMFLMPPDLVELIVREDSLELDSIPDLWKFCERLQVSFSSAVEHLCNLGFIDELTRDAMKQQVIESHSPPATPG